MSRPSALDVLAALSGRQRCSAEGNVFWSLRPFCRSSCIGEHCEKYKKSLLGSGKIDGVMTKAQPYLTGKERLQASSTPIGRLRYHVRFPDSQKSEMFPNCCLT